MEDCNKHIFKSEGMSTLCLTQKQLNDPEQNLSIPYLQCKFKLGYHEAERVYYQLLKQSGCAT